MSYHIQFRRNGRCVKKMGDYPSREAAVADGEALVAAGTVPANVQLFACEGASKKNPAKKRSASKTKKSAARKNPKSKRYPLGGGWYGTIGGIGSGGPMSSDVDENVRAYGFAVWRPWGSTQPAMIDPFAQTLDAAKRNAKEWVRANYEEQVRAKYGPWATDYMAKYAPPSAKRCKNPSTRTRSNPFKLTKYDKEVLRAFLAGLPRHTLNLSTDGRTLDINGMGGKGVARWEGNHFTLHDLGSKSSETVRKALLREAPLTYVAPESHWALSAPQRKSLQARGLYRGPDPVARRAMKKHSVKAPLSRGQRGNPRSVAYMTADGLQPPDPPGTWVGHYMGRIAGRNIVQSDDGHNAVLDPHDCGGYRIGDTLRIREIPGRFAEVVQQVGLRQSRENPRILGHDVAKSSAGYTVKPYGKSFKTKAGATKWLKGHVKRESKKR